MAAEAMKDKALETPDAVLHRTDVSERNLELTNADDPNRNLLE